MSEDSIWLDKRIVALVVLQKETDLIETYSQLIKDIKKGSIDLEKINDWSIYHGSWSLLRELHSFLRYNKLQGLLNKKSTEKQLITKINLLNDIMEKYDKPESKLTFNDLQTVIPIMHELISLCGYHDDTYKSGGSLFDEESN